MQQNNVFTIAKRNVDGLDMLYQSLKLTIGIWVLNELKIQAGNPNITVSPPNWFVSLYNKITPVQPRIEEQNLWVIYCLDVSGRLVLHSLGLYAVPLIREDFFCRNVGVLNFIPRHVASRKWPYPSTNIAIMNHATFCNIFITYSFFPTAFSEVFKSRRGSRCFPSVRHDPEIVKKSMNSKALLLLTFWSL